MHIGAGVEWSVGEALPGSRCVILHHPSMSRLEHNGCFYGCFLWFRRRWPPRGRPLRLAHRSFFLVLSCGRDAARLQAKAQPESTTQQQSTHGYKIVQKFHFSAACTVCCSPRTTQVPPSFDFVCLLCCSRPGCSMVAVGPTERPVKHRHGHRYPPVLLKLRVHLLRRRADRRRVGRPSRHFWVQAIAK